MNEMVEHEFLLPKGIDSPARDAPGRVRVNTFVEKGSSAIESKVVYL